MGSHDWVWKPDSVWLPRRPGHLEGGAASELQPKEHESFRTRCALVERNVSVIVLWIARGSEAEHGGFFLGAGCIQEESAVDDRLFLQQRFGAFLLLDSFFAFSRRIEFRFGAFHSYLLW